jgi:hypothetical protein
MIKNLHYYRSELKSKNILRYKTIGIVSELILSKEVFTRNKDIEFFLKHIFNITYKYYVIRSRTMIIARTTRVIYSSNDEEYEFFRKRLLEFVMELNDDNTHIVKNNKDSSFSKWFEGILND